MHSSTASRTLYLPAELKRKLRYHGGREGTPEGSGYLPPPLGAPRPGGAPQRAHVYSDLPGRPSRSAAGSPAYPALTPPCADHRPSPLVALSPLAALSPQPPPDRLQSFYSTLAVRCGPRPRCAAGCARPPYSPRCREQVFSATGLPAFRVLGKSES